MIVPKMPQIGSEPKQEDFFDKTARLSEAVSVIANDVATLKGRLFGKYQPDESESVKNGVVSLEAHLDHLITKTEDIVNDMHLIVNRIG